MKATSSVWLPVLLVGLLLPARPGYAGESPYLYGIFGYDLTTNPDDNPQVFLNHVAAGAGPGWVTTTVAVGSNTNDTWGVDYTPLASQGVTVICRINNGYFPNGTIPPPAKYDDFATRVTNFVAHSPGCSIWSIGNELNIQGEWPYDSATGKLTYVDPTTYATCFRKVYNAIKAIHPTDKVLPAAPACYAGPTPSQSLPYLGTNYLADAMPINWVQHLNQMLTAIKNTGPLDGIALHITSRGYSCSAIHSTATMSANGQALYNSFLVYKDWINYGIPASLRNLPLYATECNGYDTWGNYDFGYNHWVQEVYAEINRYNQCALSTNGPVFRCLNLYRWVDPAQGYNIHGSPYESTILYDLDQAVAQKYMWPTSYAMLLAPIGLNFLDPASQANELVNPCIGSEYNSAGVVPQTDWINLTQGGTGTSVDAGGGVTVTWTTPGGGTHYNSNLFPDGANYSLMSGYLDTGDTTSDTVVVSGLKFPLYDIIAYTDGDNGDAIRVTRFTVSGPGITTASKYVRDDANVNFYGTFIESDSTIGGISAAAGNYCRFHNLRASSFTITSKGDYASDPHPRGPFNAMQIVPINVIPVLTDPGYTAGQFHFYLNGATNMNYAILASTNLVNWDRVSTNVAPSLVTLPTTGYPLRFYRALFL